MNLSPIERKMYEALSDGQIHSTDDLRQHCAPSSISQVKVHMYNLRRKLPVGENIVFVNAGKRRGYMRVRLLNG